MGGGIPDHYKYRCAGGDLLGDELHRFINNDFGSIPLEDFPGTHAAQCKATAIKVKEVKTARVTDPIVEPQLARVMGVVRLQGVFKPNP